MRKNLSKYHTSKIFYLHWYNLILRLFFYISQNSFLWWHLSLWRFVFFFLFFFTAAVVDWRIGTVPISIALFMLSSPPTTLQLFDNGTLLIIFLDYNVICLCVYKYVRKSAWLLPPVRLNSLRKPKKQNKILSLLLPHYMDDIRITS